MKKLFPLLVLLCLGAIAYSQSVAVNADGSLPHPSGGVGTDVYFQSGNNITLAEGFRAFEGNEFKATVRPCNSSPLYPARMAMLNEQSGTVINSNAENFGRIVEIKGSASEYSIALKIKTSGEYSLRLINGNGTMDKMLVSNVILNEGKLEKTISTSSIATGFYHVQLLYRDEVIHMQELVKK